MARTRCPNVMRRINPTGVTMGRLDSDAWLDFAVSNANTNLIATGGVGVNSLELSQTLVDGHLLVTHCRRDRLRSGSRHRALNQRLSDTR